MLAVLIALGFWLVSNTLSNLEPRRINSGFGFLAKTGRNSDRRNPDRLHAGRFQPARHNGRPLNTLLVSVLGIVLATIIGVAVGVSRLSRNWLLARLASIYVEFIRNVPLLAHLLVIYVVLQGLPPLRSAFSLGRSVFLSNRGLIIPTLAMAVRAGRSSSGWRLLPS